METCSVVLTFVSVNEIRWCNDSNETSSAVLLHGAICSSIFTKYEFLFLVLLGVKALKKQCHLFLVSL